jgi:ABC-type bacteriocin/lantibiotic exporter with double-glycine peptidase domain
MRVLNLPANFFRQYASGELSSRYSAVNQLCSLLLGSVFSTGLSSLMSLLYITQIFHYAPALVGPAMVIILISVIISVVTTLTQMKISKLAMEKRAKENGMSFALITGIQKIKLAGAEKRAFSRLARA